ncbi:hypothetical protein [Alkalicoccus saliphilus]|uniref:Uncharacterized protein n=1 Tax=Alkalicoccus saliphilus TaxID=200989 RepID=A0A2T4U3A8_9BACI|nr:hypothetical protein [Alkalicoccus saliphilus]PTL37890.1 hypothetical protein C6Y45_14205 [Alkalicoccus saliphilus]
MSTYRVISFIVLFGFVGVTLYFYTINSHFVMHVAGSHEHGAVEVPQEEEAPTIEGEITEEDGTAALHIEVENFEFVREEMGDSGYREGHAHVYINGEREGRLYGTDYPLGQVKEDELHIRVVLSSHQHEVLQYEGEEIDWETTYRP